MGLIFLVSWIRLQGDESKDGDSREVSFFSRRPPLRRVSSEKGSWGDSLRRFAHHCDSHTRQLRALRAVASVEFVKGLVVLLAGFGVLRLIHRDVWDVAESFLEWLHVSPDAHYAQVFLNLADQVTDTKLWFVALGALGYSSLRFAEAYGLWRERAWAEWLALVSGAIYLPFEIYELARRPDLIRLIIFLVNLAVVLYMAFLRMQARTRMVSSYGAAD